MNKEQTLEKINHISRLFMLGGVSFFAIIGFYISCLNSITISGQHLGEVPMIFVILANLVPRFLLISLFLVILKMLLLMLDIYVFDPMIKKRKLKRKKERDQFIDELAERVKKKLSDNKKRSKK